MKVLTYISCLLLILGCGGKTLKVFELEKNPNDVPRWVYLNGDEDSNKYAKSMAKYCVGQISFLSVEEVLKYLRDQNIRKVIIDSEFQDDGFTRSLFIKEGIDVLHISFAHDGAANFSEPTIIYPND
jgi:hypothetical protein